MRNRILTEDQVLWQSQMVAMWETNAKLGKQGTPCCGSWVTLYEDFVIRCRRCGEEIQPAGQ